MLADFIPPHLLCKGTGSSRPMAVRPASRCRFARTPAAAVHPPAHDQRAQQRQRKQVHMPRARHGRAGVASWQQAPTCSELLLREPAVPLPMQYALSPRAAAPGSAAAMWGPAVGCAKLRWGGVRAPHLVKRARTRTWQVSAGPRSAAAQRWPCLRCRPQCAPLVNWALGRC